LETKNRDGNHGLVIFNSKRDSNLDSLIMKKDITNRSIYVLRNLFSIENEILKGLLKKKKALK